MVDIWEVILPEGLNLEEVEQWRDASPGGRYGEIDGFLCTTEPIPPDRVRLLRQDV